MPPNFSWNAVLILILGALFLFGGLYTITVPLMRILGVGMLATAAGCICCGLTDGFTDSTPRGMLVRRVGIVAFIIGVPVLGYAAFQIV